MGGRGWKPEVGERSLGLRGSGVSAGRDPDHIGREEGQAFRKRAEPRLESHTRVRGGSPGCEQLWALALGVDCVSRLRADRGLELGTYLTQQHGDSAVPCLSPT